MRKNTINFIVDLITLIVMLSLISTGLIIRYILPPGSGGHAGGRGLLLWGMHRHDWGDIHFWLSMTLILLLLIHLILHWSWVMGTIRCWFRKKDCESSIRQSKRAQHLYGVSFLFGLIFLVGGFFWLSQSQVQATLESLRGQGGRFGENDWSHLELHPNQSVYRLTSSGNDCSMPANSDETGDDPLPSKDRPGRGQGGSGRGLGPGRGLGRGARSQSYGGAMAQNTDKAEVHAPGAIEIRGYMTLEEVAQLAGLNVAEIKRILKLPQSIDPGERLGRLKRQYDFSLVELRKALEARREH